MAARGSGAAHAKYAAMIAQESDQQGGPPHCARLVLTTPDSYPEGRVGARVYRASLEGVMGSPDLRTGGRTLQGKLIHSSVRFQTYSHFTSECDFS